RRDRRRQHPNLRAGATGENVRSIGGEHGGSAGKIWSFAARISPRRTAAWRHRSGSRSPRHADLRRRIDPRRDGVPKKKARPETDNTVPRRGRSEATTRVGNSISNRKEGAIELA